MAKKKKAVGDFPRIPDVADDVVVYIENKDGTVTVINDGVLQLIKGDYLYEYNPVSGQYEFKDVLQVWF